MVETMVAILVTTKAASVVTLVAPPPLAMTEEERETRLPASPGGGPHGSPSRSEPEVLGVDAARLKAKRLPVGHKIEVVEVSSDDEAGDGVEPSTPSQELVVVQSSAGPSSGLGATDLVWACPEDLRKVRFILWDEQEDQLWDVLGARGLAMESDLAQTRVKLEEALERVKSIQQAVMVDLPHVVEVSFLCSSLTPWSFISCLSMLASCFVGSSGDVEPQVLFPPDGACSGGRDVAAGGRA